MPLLSCFFFSFFYTLSEPIFISDFIWNFKCLRIWIWRRKKNYNFKYAVLLCANKCWFCRSHYISKIHHNRFKRVMKHIEMGISQTDHHKLHIISADGRKVEFFFFFFHSTNLLPIRLKMAQTICATMLVCMCAMATINTCCGLFQCLRLFWIIHMILVHNVRSLYRRTDSWMEKETKPKLLYARRLFLSSIKRVSSANNLFEMP